MSSGSWPNFNAWLQTAWGAGAEYWSVGYAQWFAGATNLVFGQNPPYYLDNFAALYPKFFGPPTALANCATQVGSPVITVPLGSFNGLLPGQFIQGGGVPPGSIIIGLGSGTVTLNQNATATLASTTLQVYANSPLPLAVVCAYLRLANASLVQARWQEEWWLAMAWFIAHYCTLWLETDGPSMSSALQTVMHGEVPQGTAGQAVYTLSGPPTGGALQSLTNNGLFLQPGVDYALSGSTITLNSPTNADTLYAVWPTQALVQGATVPLTPAQIAAQAVSTGIMVSKSVGDVSASYAALTSLEAWGQWNLTKYGQQLATMAKVIGSGPMVIW